MSQTQRRPVVFLHIGPMKTGTSYVQNLMAANKERLQTTGHLFPGGSWDRQVRGVQDVLRRTRHDPQVRAAAQGAWAALAREVLEYDGHASIVSVEFLSFAGAAAASRVLRSLDAAEVHVVLTVRDVTAIIPSRWPTEVHNGSTVSWPSYTRALRTGAVSGRQGRLSPFATVRRFSKAQDVERILRVWGDRVSPDHLHVVTVPPPPADRRLLWSRFATAVGMDPAECAEPPRSANESLGYPSTELLRRVNRQLGRMRPSDYNPTVKAQLALNALDDRRLHERRVLLDPMTFGLGLAWNARAREVIVRSGARLVGDLDDLPVHLSEDERRRLAVPQPPPTEEEQLAAAAPAADAMVNLVRRRARHLRRRGQQVTVETFDASVAAERWRSASDPVEAAAADIARLARTAIELHRRLRA